MSFRTDLCRNPAAMTTDLAAEGGLKFNVEYAEGLSFTGSDGKVYWTAKLLGDPLQLTIRVIDAVGFYTASRSQRWTYAGMFKWVWDALTPPQKRDVIGQMYQQEGGVQMQSLFPNYGKLPW
jgi:hypothetical protein